MQPSQGHDQRWTLHFQMHLLAIYGHPASFSGACVLLALPLDVGSVWSCVIGYLI